MSKGKPTETSAGRQVMFRVRPEIYEALEVIALGRPEMNGQTRKNSVGAIVTQFLDQHEAEIKKDAAMYLKWPHILEKLTRTPDGFWTRRRSKNYPKNVRS
jgi:hypothetical protein